MDGTDERAFAGAVHDLHTQPGLRDERVAKGRARATRFTDAMFASGLFALLDEFESSGGAGAPPSDTRSALAGNACSPPDPDTLARCR